jgi:hypothetical protein
MFRIINLHTSLVTSSDLAKTASLFEPTSTSAEPTKTNQEVLAGMSSGRLETTHSSPSMLLESPVSVPNHSATKSFSKPTRTSTGLDSHTVSGDQTSQDTFSSIVPSPSGSLNATTPANYISSNQSATITSISSSTASLGSSISAADYLTTGAYTFPKLHVSNGLAAASGNFSGIARPNSSFSEQNMSTTGAHVKPTIDLSNIYSTASNISGTATLNSSAVHHSIALPSSIRSTTPRVQGMILLASRALTPGSLLRCFLSSRGRKRVRLSTIRLKITSLVL